MIDVNFIENTTLKNNLEEIFLKDQEVRQGYSDIVGVKNYNKKEIADFYYKEVAKVDSLNSNNFRVIINRLGEWPGSKYIKRKPGEPKLEVMIGHFPESDYVDFTLQAYEAARYNTEYWSRVIAMVNFSRTRPIEKSYIENSQIIIPFRFIDFNKSELIIVENDIMHLEFETITNSTITPIGEDGNIITLTYELSSSLENLDQRKKILNQAKGILQEKGLKDDFIKIDFNKADYYNDYVLFYKIIL